MFCQNQLNECTEAALLQKSLEKLEEIVNVRLNFCVLVCVLQRLTKSYSHATSHSLKKKLSVSSFLPTDINCTQAGPLCWTAVRPPLNIFEGLPFFYCSLVGDSKRTFHRPPLFKSPPFWLQLPIEWQKWLAYLIEFREQFVQQGETRYPVPADCLFVFY